MTLIAKVQKINYNYPHIFFQTYFNILFIKHIQKYLCNNGKMELN